MTFLIWNKRLAITDFSISYEKILETEIPEYKEVSHNNITPEMIYEFIPDDQTVKKIPNNQFLDWSGLVGRFRSSSYTPRPHTKEYEELEARLKEIFRKYEHGGRISFDYETEIYSGRIF